MLEQALDPSRRERKRLTPEVSRSSRYFLLHRNRNPMLREVVTRRLLGAITSIVSFASGLLRGSKFKSK
jgi:hypothetical protein